LFTNWLNAYAAGNAPLESFYRQRFRPEFKQAFENWLATKPKQNPNAPTSPFAMPEYQLAMNDKAALLETMAVKATADAAAANEQSDKYVFQTVILASMLFFTGISQQVRWLTGRALLLCAALLMLLFSISKLLSYPIE
jgi:hypothetical protein